MDSPKHQLPDLSDALLSAADEVKRLETEKRKVPISTPDFHRLADRIEDEARRVFRIAGEEEEVGDDATTGSATIDDMEHEPEALDGSEEDAAG